MNEEREVSGQRFVDLRTLSELCGLSVRTLRSLIHDPSDCLPSYKLRGKIIVDLKEFSRFVRRHRVDAMPTSPGLGDLADEILKDVGNG